MAHMEDDGCWYASRDETYNVSGLVTVSIGVGMQCEGTVTEEDLRKAEADGWYSDNAICRSLREKYSDIIPEDGGEVVGLKNLVVREYTFKGQSVERWIEGDCIAEVFVSFDCSNVYDYKEWDENLNEALFDSLCYECDIVDEGDLDIEIVKDGYYDDE